PPSLIDDETPETVALESLCEPEAFRMGIAVLDPRSFVVAGAFHHQRIALPVSYRVTHPGRIRIFRQLAPIHKDLAVLEVFGKNQHQTRRLHDLYHRAARGN